MGWLSSLTCCWRAATRACVAASRSASGMTGAEATMNRSALPTV